MKTEQRGNMIWHCAWCDRGEDVAAAFPGARITSGLCSYHGALLRLKLSPQHVARPSLRAVRRRCVRLAGVSGRLAAVVRIG